MVAWAMFTIELVCMVNPDVAIVCIQRDTIVHATHNCKVAELHTFRIAYQEAEAADCSVVADTLDGERHLAVLVLTLDLDALLWRADAIEVVLLNESDKAEGDRCRVVSFLVGVKDGLEARYLFHIRVFRARFYFCLHRLCRILGDIEHFGTILQRTVSLVGTRSIVVHEGKALAAIVLHLQHLCLAGKLCQLRVVTIYGNHLQLIIGACLQTYQIGASVGTVVAHQFIVDNGVFGILPTLYIYIVFLDIVV